MAHNLYITLKLHFLGIFLRKIFLSKNFSFSKFLQPKKSYYTHTIIDFSNFVHNQNFYLKKTSKITIFVRNFGPKNVLHKILKN
jgi:hypothetical protein